MPDLLCLFKCLLIRRYIPVAVKQGYGTGRARLPGLKDMMLGMDGGMAGASGVESGSESILNVPANEAVSSSDGDSDNAVTGPNLSTYLHFGRLMGETPDMVQRQLDAAGVPVPVDERSQQFIQVRVP